MAKTDLKVIISGDAKKLQGALGDADRSVGGFMNGKLAGVAGVIAGAFAVDKIVSFGTELFNLGGELELLDNKISTVFGSSEGDIRSWADKTNEALGLSETQTAGLAANIADLLIPMGMARDEAADMSMETVDLAGALSLYSGGTISSAEASDILTKAYLGERDALTSLGIKISQAEVDERALAIARADGREEINQMDQALATQELALEKTADAQAAYAESQEGLVGQTNVLKAKWADLKETMARGLLPIFTKIATFLVDKAIPAFEDLWNTVGPVVTNIKDAIQDFVDTFQGAEGSTNETTTKIKSILTKLGSLFGSVFVAIEATVRRVVAIIKWIWERWGDEITGYLSATLGNLLTIIEGALTVIQGVFALITAIMEGDWSAAWEAIKQILSGAWGIIKGLLSQAWEYITSIFGIIKTAIVTVWSAAWNGIKAATTAAISQIVTWLGEIAGKAKSALGNLLGTLVQKGKDLLQGMWNGLKAQFDNIKSWFGGLPDRAIAAIKNVHTVLRQTGKDIINGLWNGLKSKWNEVTSWFTSITDQIPDWKGPAEKDKTLLTRNGQLVMEGFRDGLQDGWRETQSLLNGFTTDLPQTQIGTLTNDYGMPGRAAMSQPNNNITVNVASNADPFDIANEIAWKMRTAGV